MTILIANRGEIAVRVRRTAERLGYHCVTLQHGFLDPDAVIAAARDAGAWAIHPGYGFLSERPDFAERCATEGFTFIGPPASAMRALGDKAAAKKLVAQIGAP